jgi:hypothetical protein
VQFPSRRPSLTFANRSSLTAKRPTPFAPRKTNPLILSYLEKTVKKSANYFLEMEIFNTFASRFGRRGQKEKWG